MKIYYLNSTHWDREWYLPFQSFRFNLVEMVDGLLDIMEQDPEYKLFCFDGQTIVLQDYTEIVPEGAARLRRLIDAGRLVVGPWYAMPDEFLVSGESLIRNLMTGHALAEKWGGKPWKYGYANDIFGHIAQMPQIYAGFDIHGSYLCRGLGTTDFNHFVWQAPDGTKCYTSISGYGSFARSKIDQFGTEGFPELLKSWIDRHAQRSDAPIVFFSNTDDHKKATAHTPQVLKLIQELFPDAEVVDADLSVMAEELKRYESCLPIICGELNRPQIGGKGSSNMKLLYHCLSSYYPLKQENDRCQNLLEKRIEPMLAISEMEGQPIRHQFVDAAYRYLLQNHPHDSICGCSGDQVHKDMIYRYDQVKQICDRLYERFLEFRPSGAGEDYELRVYNFTPVSRKRFVTVKLDFFSNYLSTKGGYALKEYRNNFKLYSESGSELPYQILHIERNVKKRIPERFQAEEAFDVYTVCFEADIPAFGFSSYKVSPCTETVAYSGCLPCGDNWAENDWIRLQIRPNGELDITDKRTKKTYTRLHKFSDSAETGDGWRHESPVNDCIFSGFGSQTTVSLVHRGFACVTFRIEKEILLPAFLNDGAFTRSEEKKPLAVTYTVCVRQDSPAVEITLTVKNNIKDHRLQLLFPTGVGSDTCFAGQAFYCVERKTGANPETLTWLEPECVEKNMNGILGTRGTDGTGLAFVCAEGLHEGGVDKDPESTMAVTLFRCFDRVYLQTKAVRSQLQQEMTFRYAVVPMDEKTDYSELLYIQHCLAQTDIACSRRMNEEETVAHGKSYFELDNSKVQVSVFKCAQDANGWILRLYHASGEAGEATLQLSVPCSRCIVTNMNEEALEEATVADGKVLLHFRPWEIKTLRICP